MFLHKPQPSQGKKPDILQTPSRCQISCKPRHSSILKNRQIQSIFWELYGGTIYM